MSTTGITRQGVQWVSNVGVSFREEIVDAQKIKAALRNIYVSNPLKSLCDQVFPDYYKIRIYDPDGNEDPDLAEQFLQEFEARGVEFWTNFRVAFRDAYCYGTAIYNPVWVMKGGERVLTELRRLPPETFDENDTGAIYCDLLQGISLREDGTLKFIQTVNNGIKVQLTNVKLVKDPSIPGLAGESQLIPVMPFLNMAKFDWRALMQKVNRQGAPIIFIRIENPSQEDIDLANEILKNWGKSTPYILPENFTIIEFKPAESQTAEKVLEAIEKRIKAHFDLAPMMERDGATLNQGSGKEDLSLIAVRSIHRWIEVGFEVWVQEKLTSNGYVDYRGVIEIDPPSVDTTEQDISIANTGFTTKVLTKSEIRVLLKHDGLPDELEDIREQLDLDYPAAPPPMFGMPSPFGSAPKDPPEKTPDPTKPCPKCGEDMDYDGEKDAYICPECGYEAKAPAFTRRVVSHRSQDDQAETAEDRIRKVNDRYRKAVEKALEEEQGA